MKVFANRIYDNYRGGLLLVAANSIEEAHEVCMRCDKLKNIYWHTYTGTGERECCCTYKGYCKDDFEEIPNLSWKGEPCVIAEDSYYE